ncbi:MAG: anthranilate phosphoribosyltransferase [bacterium]
MDITQALQRVLDGNELNPAEMQAVMQQIMTGQATDAQIGGFLIALRMKGETSGEIAAAASVMRQLATPVRLSCDHQVDIVGTGGDSSGTFNVSTASAFVAAAAGAHVAKHGNRSVSSKSGSADLLEQAGVNLALTPEQVARCIEEIGVGFMFAVNHHGAMKHAIGPRKQLGVRTLFNLLGPLTNPAGVPNMVLGVFAQNWVRPLAEVMKELGARHVMVVNSKDGLDEISIAAPTHVAELKEGGITEYQVSPEDFGLTRASLEDVRVNGPEESLAMVKQALSADGGAPSDIVSLNAGAAIYVAGIADSLTQGVLMAQDAIGSGLAKSKLTELASFSRCFEAPGAAGDSGGKA